MESSSEEHGDSLKISDTEIADKSTCPSSVSSKKPIQLGIVQSSSGVRASTGNLNLTKKSRWDQAPGPGEIEEELKDATIQPSNQEDSKIKNLIKKFEDISSSSKVESPKSDEGSSSKPGRVKLVRTNFAKPEIPAAKPIDVEKIVIETSKIDPTTVETEVTIEKSPDDPLSDVISVSSSKALQIISSNYDSPTDESSQEADNSTKSENQRKSPLDSAYASLERLTESNELGKCEDSIEERLNSALSLKNESQSKFENNETENSNALTAKAEEITESVKEEKAETPVNIESDEGNLNIHCSQISEGENEFNKAASDEIVSNESNETKPDEPENIYAEKEIADKHLDKIQQISQISSHENISNEKINAEDDGDNIMKTQDMESEKPSNQNISENTDNIELTLTKVSDVNADFAEKPSDETMLKEMNNENKDMESGIPSNQNLSENTDNTELAVTEASDVNAHVAEKPTDETMSKEKNNENFVNIAQAVTKEHNVGNDSTSVTDCVLADVSIKSPKIQMSDTENLEDDLLVELNVENRDILKGCENVRTVTKAEEKDCLHENQTESKELPGKNPSKLLETDHNKAKTTDPLFEDKGLGENIFEKEPAYENPKSSDDVENSYYDGVDAKMEQIFSEIPENVNEEICSSEQNIEEKTSFEHELVQESLISEDSATSGWSSKNEDLQNTVETNDSLLKMLQSGGSPEVVPLQKDKDNPDIGFGEKELEKSNTEEAMPTIDVVLNDSENTQLQSNLETSTEQVNIDSEDINDIVTKKACSREKSPLKEEITIQHATEDILIEEKTKAVDSVNLVDHIEEEDTQVMVTDNSGNDTVEEESEIIIEEVNDDSATEDSSQILEAEVTEECNENIQEGCAEPQADIEVPESRDIVIEEVSCSEVPSDSKNFQDSIEMEGLAQLIEMEEITSKPAHADIKERKEDSSDLGPFGSIEGQNVDRNLSHQDKGEPEITKTEINITLPDKVDVIEKSETDSAEGSKQNKLLDECRELHKVEDASILDSKHTLKEAEGSVEVSQQETIERSIDMLFEMPCSDQLMKPSTLYSASSTKDVKLEVTSETKKLFSEEIQKEMLKLSPEHEVQPEEKMVHSPDPNSVISPSRKTETKTILESECTDVKVSDSYDLPSKRIVDDERKTSNVSIELNEEKEAVIPSDDSDIATIQAIDTFLEEDADIKNLSRSNSKSEKLPDDSVVENKVKPPPNEEDSNNFVDSSSTNERTNAEDVMLGVEGDLDLDNSLTYDTKKLDLSPSTPTNSEENYDLPDLSDSYDKESLVKEQESTTLLSDVLDNTSVPKDSDPSLQISKNKQGEEPSSLKTNTDSEDYLKDQFYEEIADKEIKDDKLDHDLNSDKIQPSESSYKSKTEANKPKINENSLKGSLIKETPLLLQTHKEIEENILKTSVEKEPSQVFGGQAQDKVIDKFESSEIEDVFPATSNEPEPNVSEFKDVNLDFENLIPSTTVSSNDQAVQDSNSVITDSCEVIKDSLNKLKEQSVKTGKPISKVIDENVVIGDSSKQCDIKELNDSKVIEESLCPEITSEKIEIKPSAELPTEKTHPNTIEMSSSSVQCLSPKDSLDTDSNNKPNEEENNSVAASSSKDRAAPITEESKHSKRNIPDENDLRADNKSIPPKDSIIELPDVAHPSIDSQNKEQKHSLETFSNPTRTSVMEHVESDSPKKDTESITRTDKQSVSSPSTETISTSDLKNQTLSESTPSVVDQGTKLSKSVTSKEIPAPVRVSARQKQRQAAAAAALAAKEKAEAEKSPGQGSMIKKGKKSLSPTKELHVKVSGKSPESGKQSPLSSQKSPKTLDTKLSLQMSPKKINREVGQDKLEPITLKLSKEENPVIVRSSSLSPKKNVAPHSPQGKTLGYTLKIGKDSTTIIPKDSSPSPTRRDSSPGTGGAKADLSGKVGYLIKDTGLTITPVAPAETQEQKLSKITLKLSKAGGHPEIKQEKSETWKAIRKLGEIDIVPVEGKSQTDSPKRKDKCEEGNLEKKPKLADVTMEPSTSSGVSKLQGLLTQAPLNQSDSSEDGKFIGFGSPTEKAAPAQQQQKASYDIGMIRHDDSPQPPRKRGRPRKITSPDDIVHSVSVPRPLTGGLTAKDILTASLQHQSLQQQQQIHPNYPPSYPQPQEDLDSSQPMVPLFDLFEETYMDPTPPTIFPDQVQPSTDVIMRSARGRPIGRSRRPRGSGLIRGHERGGPRGRPRGSRGIKRILEEMEAMSFPDPDQPITLENIDAEMGPRIPEHAASELTMALLRRSIEGKKEILEKRARKSEGSEEGNGDLDAQVREMKEKIEAAYQAELKSPSKEGKKRTPEKLELTKKSPPGLIPLLQRQEERRKSAEGKEAVKRKLSEDKTEEGQKQAKRKSTDEKPESSKLGECSIDETSKDDSQMEVDQPGTSSEDPNEQKEEKTEPEPPPKPVKPRPKSKAEIKRIKREKDRLRREAKKLAALEALKAPSPNPCEEDTRMSASDPNGEGLDGEGGGIKKNRMEVGDPEGKEFTVEQIAEYQWPLQGGELYMIQEQISTWLGVKSFQRKYPDLKRRRVEMEERTYLCDSGLVAETMCDLGLTAVSSSEVLDIMFQDFPDQYEELRKHMREKQARELINKQKERKKFEQTLSKSDLKEHAIQSLVSWNANLNRSRNESRKCHLDLQTWTIQYPRSKAAKMTRPAGKLGNYPVALIPGQYADYYKRYTPAELRYFPLNTVLYGPLQPNELHSTGGSDGSQSESEDSSSSDGTSDSSSEGEGTEEDEKERERGRECKTCGSKKSNEAMLQCSQCSHNIHVSCADLNPSMLAHVRKYQWQCSVCKTCQRCDNAKNESKMLFCDLCDRGYHSYCVGLRRVPSGSWTCELCSADSEGS